MYTYDSLVTDDRYIKSTTWYMVKKALIIIIIILIIIMVVVGYLSLAGNL